LLIEADYRFSHHKNISD